MLGGAEVPWTGDCLGVCGTAIVVIHGATLPGISGGITWCHWYDYMVL